MKRVCLRCQQVYQDRRNSPFRTCQQCRIAVSNDGGGCRHWDNTSDHNPRVTKHREASAVDTDMAPG